MHGFGVSPRAYAADERIDDARLKSSRRSSVTCGSPRPWQVARAGARRPESSRRDRCLGAAGPARAATSHRRPCARPGAGRPRCRRRRSSPRRCAPARAPPGRPDRVRWRAPRLRAARRPPPPLRAASARRGRGRARARRRRRFARHRRKPRGSPLPATRRVSEDLARHEPRLLTVSSRLGSRRSGRERPASGILCATGNPALAGFRPCSRPGREATGFRDLLARSEIRR